MVFISFLFWLIVCLVLLRKDKIRASRQQRIYEENKRNGRDDVLQRNVKDQIIDDLIKKGYNAPYNLPCPVTWLDSDWTTTVGNRNSYLYCWNENRKSQRYETVGDRQLRYPEFSAFHKIAEQFIKDECDGHHIEEYADAQSCLKMIEMNYIPWNFPHMYMTQQDIESYNPYRKRIVGQ